MKKLKSFLSVFTLLALVGSMLAFEKMSFSPGNVWCFSTFPNPSQSCASQEGGTQTPFITVIYGGFSRNPCLPLMEMPFINGSDICLPPPLGQQYLSE